MHITENNPSWTTFFYVPIPVFLVVISLVLFLKFLKNSLERTIKKKPEHRQDTNEGNRMHELSSMNIVLITPIGRDMVGVVEQCLPLNINAYALLGKSALHCVAAAGIYGVATLLAEKGADVNAASSRDGRIALQAASDGGHLAVVEQLRQAAMR